MTSEVSIKAFAQAMYRAGMYDDPLRGWLDDYDNEGTYNRKSLGEDCLSVAYSRVHSTSFLETICNLSGVETSRIVDAANKAHQPLPPPTCAKIFRQIIPWSDVAKGAQDFISNFAMEISDLGTIERRSSALLFKQSELELQREKNNVGSQIATWRWAIQRNGQEKFRSKLLNYWKSKCPLTGIDEPKLLRASHIKSWAECDEGEHYNVYNGILIAAHLDAAFDAGLISFTNDGQILRSPYFTYENFSALNLPSDIRLQLSPQHYEFLEWHRTMHDY